MRRSLKEKFHHCLEPLPRRADFPSSHVKGIERKKIVRRDRDRYRIEMLKWLEQEKQHLQRVASQLEQKKGLLDPSKRHSPTP